MLSASAISRTRPRAHAVAFCAVTMAFLAARSARAETDFACVLDAPAGELRVPLARAQAAELDTLILPAVTLDGALQTGFQPVADAPPGMQVFANQRVRIEIEPPVGNSTAVRWTALDGADHDFVIAIADNSAYYGCGERFSSLNHKGHIPPMVSIDRPEDKGSVTYKPVPFYMSTRGYAAWLDSPRPGEFDFNATQRDHVLLRYRAASLRLVLIDGPDMAAMLAEFTRLTSRPRVPPLWSFAPWKSRDVHKNRDEILADVELTRRHDLPGSIIVIDSPWETGYNDFILNETQFTAPDELFRRVAELGFYPVFWLTPFINSENAQDMAGITPGASRNFAEARDRGFLVRDSHGGPMLADWWKGRGGLVDFTNPDATVWWHDQLDQARRWGLRGLKCDDGEGNFVQDAVFHDGTPAADMKNRYALLYLQAAQAYLDDRLGGDGLLLARCGFTGTQSQPFGWAGDNDADFSYENGLPTVILAGQNAALSGQPFWGSDIAGYMGRPTKEVFIRWTQFAAFSPLMLVHMTSNLGPWDFDDETLSIYRTFAKLHTSLTPYMLDAAHAATDSGLPIIRPMVLAFPNDRHAARHRYQYLFGPDLLVAPMYQNGTHRAVYLPHLSPADAPENTAARAGHWLDFWTGEPHAGGQTIEVHAPLARMPLFVRAGAILPLLPDDIDTLIPRAAHFDADVVAIDDRRVIQIWPGPGGTLTTAEGISVTTAHDAGRLNISASSTTPRPLEIRLMHASADPAAADPSWSFDAATRTARYTLQAGPQPVTITRTAR